MTARSPHIPPLSIPTQSLSDELFNELRGAVRGPVFRRSDAEYVDLPFDAGRKALS